MIGLKLYTLLFANRNPIRLTASREKVLSLIRSKSAISAAEFSLLFG